MGWFDDLDYKRMLLSFDKILYLLPQTVTAYQDARGSSRTMIFPSWLSDSEFFTVHHFVPDDEQRALLRAAAEADSGCESFFAVTREIPGRDRLYTWQVANADADLTGEDSSVGLRPDQVELAHALLLNKFLLAADVARCVPISGQNHVHRLLTAKMREAVSGVRQRAPELEPTWLRTQDVKHGPVTHRLIESFVSDEQLGSRSFEEIVAFKAENRDLFERFSVVGRRLVREVETLPGETGFDREVEELLSTEVWSEAKEVKAALQSAWARVFKEDVRHALRGMKVREVALLGGAIGVGILPLSFEGLTLASVVGAGLTTASWAHSKFIEYAAQRANARKNGLYFLMKFSDMA